MVVSKLDRGRDAYTPDPVTPKGGLSMQPQLTISPVFGDPRLPTRFWEKVRVLDNGCWEWQAVRTRKGYGRFTIHPRKYLAHRVSYAALVGPIAEGLQCQHRCDNPPCCNPLHLFLGTHLDNMAQMRRKNRHPGAALGRKRQGWNPYSKLTEDDVRMAREAYVLGTPQAHIAAYLGVHSAHISRVVRGRSWRHVT